AENRRLWGPVLATMQNVAPREVTYSSFSLQGGDSISISLSGLAAGTEPRRVAETFRQGLITTFSQQFSEVRAGFRTLEETGSMVSLDGENLPTARFDIDISCSKEKSPEIAQAANTSTP